MKDFQATTSVERIADAWAVVRVEQWRRTGGAAIATLVRNKVMADGPFTTRDQAETALARIGARAAGAAT